MPALRSPRRAYDHRIRQLICATKDPRIFPDLGIPRSTTASWIARGPRPVETASRFDPVGVELEVRVLLLERRVQMLGAVVRLLVALVRVSGFQLDATRLPEGRAKGRLLRAIAGSSGVLPLRSCLQMLRLSPARYHAWKQAGVVCELDDRPSCPRSFSAQLTAIEVTNIGEMVRDPGYRHMSLRALALHAQRVGRVVASPTTWARLTRKFKWRRPRRRRYPAKPKVGIRAHRPDETWHIDVTVIKLLDGTRTYLHAIIDNLSRRILAWRLVERLDPTTTCEILDEAGRHLDGALEHTSVIADSGIENAAGVVDDFFDSGRLRRIFALVDVSFSNSLIERWWSVLRYSCIYLHDIDTFATVKRLVAICVQQHNSVMPHAAFNGQTPDEVYFQVGEAVPHLLIQRRVAARAERIEANRSALCGACPARGAPRDEVGVETVEEPASASEP